MRMLEVGDTFINFDLVYKVKLTDTHDDDVIDSANVHFVDLVQVVSVPRSVGRRVV